MSNKYNVDFWVLKRHISDLSILWMDTAIIKRAITIVDLLESSNLDYAKKYTLLNLSNVLNLDLESKQEKMNELYQKAVYCDQNNMESDSRIVSILNPSVSFDENKTLFKSFYETHARESLQSFVEEEEYAVYIEWVIAQQEKSWKFDLSVYSWHPDFRGDHYRKNPNLRFQAGTLDKNVITLLTDFLNLQYKLYWAVHCHALMDRAIFLNSDKSGLHDEVKLNIEANLKDIYREWQKGLANDAKKILDTYFEWA